MIAYHDEEWGVPLHDERRLFEMLCLEGAQAGLAWITILRKRDNFRRAFDFSDPTAIAAYDAGQVNIMPEYLGFGLTFFTAAEDAEADIAAIEATGDIEADSASLEQSR